MEWKTLDYHVCGEAVRVLMDEFYDVEGKSILEKRENLKREKIIQLTIREPRGHAGMYASIIVKSERKTSRFGVVFACNNEMYPVFCGHAMLGTLQAYADHYHIENDKFDVDVPSGSITAIIKDGKASFINQPCFVFAKNLEVKGDDTIYSVDLCWGGAFMAYVDDSVLYDDKVKSALKIGYEIEQQLKKKYDYTYNGASLRKNGALVCFIDREVIDQDITGHTLNVIDRDNIDRAAAGTSTCARMALIESKGISVKGKTLYNYALSGLHYDAECLDIFYENGIKKLLLECSAEVNLMGKSTFYLTGDDPLKKGFIL